MATLTGSMGAKPVMLLCQKIPLILGKSASLRKAPSGRRLEVDPTNFQVKRIFLWGNDQVGANSAQLAVDFIADVGGHRNHRGRYGHAQRDGRTRQQLAPLLPPKGFVNQPDEHRLLLCEHATTGRDVRLLNNDRVCRLRSLERHRIGIRPPSRPFVD